MSTLTEFRSNKIKIKEARKAAKAVVKTLFSEMSTHVFSQFPTLKSFGWTQYTPYFNDGDPCTFRSHSSYPSMTFLVDGVEENFDTDYGDDDPENPKTSEELRNNVEEALKVFFKDFDEEDLEDFGEGKVVVTRDGKIDVEDYDHD